MKKSYIFLILILVAVGLGALSLWDEQQEPLPTEKIKVVTSFYPLYFFTQEIVGDRAEVINITSGGAEPHDYEPTVQDLSHIETADLIVLNGAGLEPWAENLEKTTQQKAGQFLYVGEDIATLAGSVHEHEDEEANEQHEEEQRDPHVWLSPVRAQKMVEKIEHALIEVDPINASYYNANANVLKEKLQSLDEEYRIGLKECKKESIVTSHAAFAYLAHEYAFKQVSIAGLSPDEEPSAQSLSEVARYAKENNVLYIFFETLVSPKLSETVAKEIGAQTLVLNPLEGLSHEELMQQKNYISVMKDNLNNIKLARECTK